MGDECFDGVASKDIYREFLEEAHSGAPAFWKLKEIIEELQDREDKAENEKYEKHCEAIENATDYYEKKLANAAINELITNEKVIKILEDEMALVGYSTAKNGATIICARETLKKMIKAVEDD